MPQMGESVVEGTITKWLVKEGDQVSEDQPLVEISTDKVDTDIPSPGTGVISQIVASEGQTLAVGAVLAVIDSGAVKSSATAQSKSKPEPKAVPREALPAAPIRERQPEPSGVPMAAAAVSSPSRVATEAPSVLAHGIDEAPRRYSPVVVRIAEEHGIDLKQVPGTGVGGRVSKRDIEKYLDSLGQHGASAAPHNGNGAVAAAAKTAASRPGAAAATQPSIAPAGPSAFRPPVYQPREGDTVESFTRRRKVIAEHMVFSKTHSPHVGTVAELDLTRVMVLREAHKAAFAAREGFNLTLLPFAAMATVHALKDYPRMNASVVGDSLVIRREINLGIAMDAEEGLVVPVVKGAERLSVVGLAREIERLRRKVAEKSIAADDLAGGSFTLTNPGREGNLYGFAIINQPQVGILRMGEVKKRPVVVEAAGEDAIAIRPMMYLALSYDHRVVDGVLGNSFLYRAARILEHADFEF
ncbi:MAG: dihydrolipoamide acetyltransferase family protein [Candidatus Binataceae bacterium]